MLLIVVYILHKNWIKLFKNQIGLLFHFETSNHSTLLTLIRFNSFYHSLSFAVTHCHFLLLVVIRCHLLSPIVTYCHSLSFLVTRCTIHCHSYHSLSFVVPLVIIRYHSLYHSLSLVCLFINDRFNSTTFTLKSF